MAPLSEKSSKTLGIDIGMSHTTATYLKNGKFKHKSTTLKSSNSQFEKIKMFIGRRYDDPTLQQFPQNYSFTIVKWDPVKDKTIKSSANINNIDDLKLCYKGELVDPIEPMIERIAELKECIEDKIRCRIDNITISIPVRSDNNQKSKMMLACKFAGFETIRVLSEASAVALAYTYDCKVSNRFRRECIFVIDIGNSNIDVGIFELNKIDGKDHLSVLALDGDCTGGCNFDEVLVNYCIENLSTLGFNDNLSEERKLAMFRSCEKARKILSKENEAEIKIGLFQDDKDFSLKISKEEFEIRCEDLFKKLMGRIKGTLILMKRMKPYYDEGGFYKTNSLDEAFMDAQKTEIDHLILSGQFSKTPKLQELISDYFKDCKISKNYIDKEATSMGTAYHAILHSGELGEDDEDWLVFEDVIPYPFTMISDNGKTTEIFRKNDFYPSSRVITVETDTENQTETNFKIIEGNDDDYLSNLTIKHCVFSGIPPAPKGTYRVPFDFILDYNGLLNIFIINHNTGEHDYFYTSNLYGKISESELDRIKEDVVCRREYRKKNFLKIKLEEKLFKLSMKITESELNYEQRKIQAVKIEVVQESLNSSESITKEDYKQLKKKLKKIKKEFKKLLKDDGKSENSESDDKSNSETVETELDSEESKKSEGTVENGGEANSQENEGTCDAEENEIKIDGRAMKSMNKETIKNTGYGKEIGSSAKDKKKEMVYGDKFGYQDEGGNDKAIKKMSSKDVVESDVWSVASDDNNERKCQLNNKNNKINNQSLRNKKSFETKCVKKEFEKDQKEIVEEDNKNPEKGSVRDKKLKVSKDQKSEDKAKVYIEKQDENKKCF